MFLLRDPDKSIANLRCNISASGAELKTSDSVVAFGRHVRLAARKKDEHRIEAGHAIVYISKLYFYGQNLAFFFDSCDA